MRTSECIQWNRNKRAYKYKKKKADGREIRTRQMKMREKTFMCGVGGKLKIGGKKIRTFFVS